MRKQANWRPRRATPTVCCALLIGCLVQWQLQEMPHGPSATASVRQTLRGTFADLAPRTDQGCTSFCLDSGGHLVFGTNYDTTHSGEGFVFINKRGVSKRGRERGTTGKVAHWVSKYGSVTFNHAAHEHAWSGMNETGLVISTMHLPGTEMPAPDSRPPLGVGQWLQYQLDNFSTVEQVIASDSQIRIKATDEDHHLVCDRTGNCATIEFIDGKLVYHTKETMPVRVLTNTGYAEALVFLNKGRKRSLDISLDRFVRAARMMRSFDPEMSGPPVTYAFDVLARVGNRRHTRWSIVYDMQDYNVYFRTRSNPRVRCLNVAALDFSCATPVKMLHVNANLSGNVADDFTDYSHQAALELLWGFSKETGLKTTLAQTDEYLNYLEGFSCIEPNAYSVHGDDSWRVRHSSCADELSLSGDTNTNMPKLAYLPLIVIAVFTLYLVYRSIRGQRPDETQVTD